MAFGLVTLTKANVLPSRFDNCPQGYEPSLSKVFSHSHRNLRPQHMGKKNTKAGICG
jgi:hypothetical protein